MSIQINYKFTLADGRVVDDSEVLVALRAIDEDPGVAFSLDPELAYLLANKDWINFTATRMASGRIKLRKQFSPGLTPKGKGLLLTGNFGAAR